MNLGYKETFMECGMPCSAIVETLNIFGGD